MQNFLIQGAHFQESKNVFSFLYPLQIIGWSGTALQFKQSKAPMT